MAGDYALSGTTALISYPKDIVAITIDDLFCKDLDAEVVAEVNDTEGTIAITRVSLKQDDKLPRGLVCFARLNITPIGTGEGTLRFIDGPVGNYSWEIVGLDHVFTPNFKDQAVTITVRNTQINPTDEVSPKLSPTATPTPTETSSPSPSPSPSIPPNPSISPSINPSTTISPTNITPTPSEAQTSTNITFDIRTQGLTQAAKAVNEIPVKVTFLQDKTVVDERIVSMSKNGDGSWTGTSQYDTLLSGVDYTLLIKGPKHLQKKICENKPSESIEGQYTCKDGAIRIHKGDNRLDLKGAMILAGDLPLQNGIVDAVDIAYIRGNLGNSNADVVARGDLNYDGIVDSQDYGIIINALGFKYDEE